MSDPNIPTPVEPTLREFTDRLAAELRGMSLLATDGTAAVIFGSISQLVLEAARPVAQRATDSLARTA